MTQPWGETSNDLLDVDLRNRARVEIDSFFEDARQALSAQGDDPSLLDDEVFDDAPADQGGAENGGVLSLGGAVVDQRLPPFVRKGIGEAVARGVVLGVHGSSITWGAKAALRARR